VKLAYLVSRYPAVSHTFILREVEAVRARGVEVETFSVRRASVADALGARERDALATTTALVPLTPLTLIGLLATIARRPGDVARLLRHAVGTANPGVRNRVWQVFYVVEALVLWRHLRRRGITHVHVHFANVAADVARLCARFDDAVSWSFTMHGPTELDDITQWDLARKTTEAAAVACISDFARSQLMAITDESVWPRLHVVRCGIDADRFDVARKSDDSALDVLCVAQLLPRKGQRVLLDAAARLRDRGVDVRVTLAGGGPSVDAVERAVDELGLRDRVKLTGPFGQEQLAGLLAAADVFCLPSFAEGVPVSLMEAMASRLPVVTTAIAGIPELVDDGVSGFVVAPGRADLLADALERLAGDADLRRRMGEAGRATVEARYSSAANAATLVAVFEQLI